MTAPEPSAQSGGAGASLAPGTTVGPYRIVRRLGAGSMGEVVLAHDPRLGREVALKFLALPLAADREARARFVREAQAVARLDHPNIVTLHEVGEHEGRPYLVMQYVEGVSLAAFAAGRSLGVATVLDLGVQLCAGLQAAHERGIVHRDLKPANVLIDSRLRARIVDFGIARVSGGTRLTSAGSLCGTLGYCPPESVLGEECDARGDLFSVGVILYELLAGRLPFPNASPAAYGYAVVHEAPPPLALAREDVPAELQAVIEKALARDPGCRPATAAELGGTLELLKRAPETGAARARPRASIAVLPFEDMSPGRDHEYLCDGIAEELIQALTADEGLRVIARTSAFAFKGRRADAREIGRSLGVGVLLEGSVRTAGDRARIGVRLVDTRDGGQLWTERFDRKLDDIFAVEDEVCRGVLERIEGSLGGPGTRAPGRRTANAEAHAAYLRARFLFHQRNVASIRRSVEYFEQAIAKDARFALAHAGLAEAYEALGAFRALPLATAYAEARQAALAAVELDDRLPEGHEALATIRFFCDWDWAGAEREYERALELDPRCVDAHHMYAHWNEAMGRFERALVEIDRALELEPVAPDVHSCRAEILFHARRFDEVVREAALTLEMNPVFAGVYGWLGMAHVLGGRMDTGLAEVDRGLAQRPGDPRLEALRGTACAIAGRGAEARACLERLRDRGTPEFVDPCFEVWPLAALGETDDAFGALERARDEHSMWVHLARVDPLMDPLRSDPRFAAFLARMGFAGGWLST